MIKAWDSDGHVSKSEVTFSDKYWDTKLKERPPTIVETGPDGPLYWMIDTRLPGLVERITDYSGFPGARRRRLSQRLQSPASAQGIH